MPEQNPKETQLTLLIDADDTLWHSNVYYIRSRDAFLDMLGALGVQREAVEQRIDREEQNNIPTLGYGPHSYAQALRATCEAMLHDRTDLVKSRALAETKRIAATVLTHPMELLPRVRETLANLSTKARLVLVTKGHDGVQRAKVDQSGLGTYFEGIYVLSEKDPQAYADIVAQLELDIDQTWMIGNSPRSDINPATAIGLRAVYIPYADTWDVELSAIEREEMVVTIDGFADLPDLFGL